MHSKLCWGKEKTRYETAGKGGWDMSEHMDQRLLWGERVFEGTNTFLSVVRARLQSISPPFTIYFYFFCNPPTPSLLPHLTPHTAYASSMSNKVVV